MTTAGWINMLLSIGVVTAVHVWCVWRVLSRSREDHELGHVAPVEEDDVEKR